MGLPGIPTPLHTIPVPIALHTLAITTHAPTLSAYPMLLGRRSRAAYNSVSRTDSVPTSTSSCG